MTFGQAITHYRRERKMTQRELASKVLKEDGEPISPQYLNDIERDRRNTPSEHLIKQFATALKVAPEVLYVYAKKFPEEFARIVESADEKSVINACAAFRRELRNDAVAA
ncbi:MAG: helix-turn-helix transcriptional regulator [Acidobacteria bacterium]|nr:helix-turn-helix transcriptional regulator [Acidobacteriota bacterium]